MTLRNLPFPFRYGSIVLAEVNGRKIVGEETDHIVIMPGKKDFLLGFFYALKAWKLNTTILALFR